MQIKRTRKLLLSTITILLCLTLLAATTYALFSTEVRLVSHISSGDLNVTLTRTNLTGKVLGTDGKLHDYHNPGHIDFTTPTKNNLFDLFDEMRVVPGIEYDATLVVGNNSEVTFGYFVEILVDEKSSSELCEQLHIVITSGDKEVSGTLASTTLGSEEDYISILDSGETSSFNVEIYFVDDTSINNSAQNKFVYFDLIVHAVQLPSSQNSIND